VAAPPGARAPRGQVLHHDPLDDGRQQLVELQSSQRDFRRAQAKLSRN
jgi:hypothetical protein